MAVVTLTIPDETFLLYSKHGISPQEAMKKQLERFKEFSPAQRVVVLSDEARGRLEKLLETTIEDTNKLAGWVEGLVKMNVDGVEIMLSEGQRKRLVGEANFYSTEHNKYIDERVRGILNRELGR